MENSSLIHVQNNSLRSLPPRFKSILQQYSQVILISTPTVFDLYGHWMKDHLHQTKVLTILIPEGEESKTLQHAEQCWKKMADFGIDRKSLLIGMGGGAVTDLSGFVASCYMRGLDTLYIPTTLLGMVDAAIGGKTGVNFYRKNLIGTFHLPKYILIDPTCLQSLPQREYCSGFAEIIKYGAIQDLSLFEKLEKNLGPSIEEDTLEEIIKRSIEIKMKIVDCDPYEQNIRALLNFGHTFAHAIEELTEYKSFLHGEAVAIGMSCAAQISVALNYLDASDSKRIDAVCSKIGLPISLPKSLNVNALVDKMAHDKKAVNGQINLILLKKIGLATQMNNVNPQLIHEILQQSQCRSGLLTQTL